MKPVARIDFAALSAFRAEIRKFLAFSESNARANGLTPVQHQLLLAIKGADARSAPVIRALAETLCVRHHTVVELADRLESRGLIRRRRDSVDARRIRLYLTAPGERVLRRLSLSHLHELRSAAPALARSLATLSRASRRAQTRNR